MGMASPVHASLWNWQTLPPLWRNSDYSCFEHAYCPSSLMGMASPAHASLWNWQTLPPLWRNSDYIQLLWTMILSFITNGHGNSCPCQFVKLTNLAIIVEKWWLQLLWTWVLSFITIMGMASPAHASLWNWQTLPPLWRNSDYSCFEHGYCPSSL